MSDPTVGKFIASIQETLIKNGYPEKKVALPLEKMYETAHAKSVNFNKVLDFLKEKGVYHTKTNEKVIFQSTDPDAPPPEPTQEAGGFKMPPFDLSSIKDMDMGQVMQAAMGAMKGMSPDQLDMIKKQIANMAPEQIEALTGMLGGLTPEQREEIAKKAKSGDFNF